MQQLRYCQLSNIGILTAIVAVGLGLAPEPLVEVAMIAAGNPAEGELAPFLDAPEFETRQLFSGGRFPSVVVSTEGTVLAFWGRETLPQIRRSEDGGATWEPLGEVGEDSERAGRGLGAAVVDETTGGIIVFMDGAGELWNQGHGWRSGDDGKTWEHIGSTESIIAPNEPVEVDGVESIPGRAITHGADSGITLRHSEYEGRLVLPARIYDEAEHDTNYNCAIYSDDGGSTWQTSAPFPAFGTGEGTLAELSDGRLYYNSRRHWAPEGETARMRHIAWSEDGGETWEDLSVSDVLPDGAQHRDYGLMGGLVRLPVTGRDILIFSNIESTEGRRNGTVWASFDGGKTWPIKRQVDEGGFAYSSAAAGRPGTPSEGWIYVLYETGGHPDSSGRIARFNLSWVLEGEPTGDGDAPEFENQE